VDNSSETYNYDEWNKQSRADAVKHVHSDTRQQPRTRQPIERQDLRLICPPGGLILFSAAQLHETVPNTSGSGRYSIDFRTVHIDDAVQHRGAPNLDSRCTGTTMRDYLRGSDLQHIPQSVIEAYDDGARVGDGALASGVEPG
jgi:hypothetical protein